MKWDGRVVKVNRHESLPEENNDFVLGGLIAEVLAFAWRNPPVSLAISDESLKSVAPLLLKSGAGALTWWRVKCSKLHNTEIGSELQQAYRMHTLQAAVKELEIKQVFLFLRSQGLEPLMGKGFAIARHYPEIGLRPYGDIDLYVRPEQH